MRQTRRRTSGWLATAMGLVQVARREHVPGDAPWNTCCSVTAQSGTLPRCRGPPLSGIGTSVMASESGAFRCRWSSITARS